MSSSAPSHKPLLKALSGDIAKSPPVWFMRQAGRYLPEYRALRAKAPSFMDFCFNPDMAAEATLQPIRRFGFDGAILFSDILVVPEALGQKVTFETGEGPRLDPIETPEGLSRLASSIDLSILAPVFETIRRVKAALPAETTFLGFCGAPWTVASYMIAGRGTPDQAPARLFAYRHPEAFQSLIDLLTQSSIAYLIEQAKAGVDAVQIFDSWAGVLPARDFRRWCLEPALKIAQGVKAAAPDLKVIAFPRGSGSHLAEVAAHDAFDAVGLDTSVDPVWAARHVQGLRPVQGNLDPLALLVGGASLDRAVLDILETLSAGPHVFNLGHGILPPTPIAHVERVLDLIRSR